MMPSSRKKFKSCFYPGCKSPDPSFKFPKDPKRIEIWETALDKKAVKSARLCSEHFLQSDFRPMYCRNGKLVMAMVNVILIEGKY